MATRMQPADRREHILDVAAAVFAAHGFSSVSMRQVAKECGMSAPGVMHHFPTMADLLTALLRRREEHNFEAARATLPADAPFRAQVEATLAFYDERPDEVRMFQMLEGESIHPEHPAHEFFRERIETFRAEYARALASEYRNADELGFLTFTVIEGLRAQQARDPEFSLLDGWRRVADVVFAAGVPRRD